MNKRLTYLLALGLSLCLASQPDQAEAYLASIKATGMAQTGAAYPQDSESAIAINPAGLVDVGNRIDGGISVIHTNKRASLQGNLVPFFNFSNRNALHNPWQIPFHGGASKCLGNNFAVGIAAYENNYAKVSYHVPTALLGTSRTKLEYLNINISPSASYRLNDIHSFGVNLNICVQRFRVQGVENFDNAFFSSSPGNVTNRGYDYAGGVSGTFGWKGDFTDSFSLGLAYTTESTMSRFKKYRGFIAGQGKLEIPQNIVAGVYYSPFCKLDLTFDIQHYWWKNVRALANPIVISGGPGSGTQLGNNAGLGFGFKNQTFYRVGAAYQLLSNLTVRAGYRYANQLINRSQTAANALLITTIKHALTIGASYQIGFIGDCAELSFYYTHGFKNKINGRNSVPITLGLGEVSISEERDGFGVGFGTNF